MQHSLAVAKLSRGSCCLLQHGRQLASTACQGIPVGWKQNRGSVSSCPRAGFMSIEGRQQVRGRQTAVQSGSEALAEDVAGKGCRNLGQQLRQWPRRFIAAATQAASHCAGCC